MRKTRVFVGKISSWYGNLEMTYLVICLCNPTVQAFTCLDESPSCLSGSPDCSSVNTKLLFFCLCFFLTTSPLLRYCHLFICFYSLFTYSLFSLSSRQSQVPHFHCSQSALGTTLSPHLKDNNLFLYLSLVWVPSERGFRHSHLCSQHARCSAWILIGLLKCQFGFGGGWGAHRTVS